MKPKKLLKRHLSNDYVDAAILHHKLLEEGDSKGSNLAHDRIIYAAREIRSTDDKGEKFLTSLLSHFDENVRLWSAVHLLPLSPEVALFELERLSEMADSWVVRSSADITLSEWRKGILDVDWFIK